MSLDRSIFKKRGDDLINTTKIDLMNTQEKVLKEMDDIYSDFDRDDQKTPNNRKTPLVDPHLHFSEQSNYDYIKR